MLNIVHIHLNDTSEQVPLDVEYLSSENYKIGSVKFDKDMSGQTLRYKILVWDYKVRDVLYNNG